MRQPQRLPEAPEPEDVAAFVTDLRTFRDRAITLLMLLGGLRAAEVRSLRLADADMGLRRVRVTGKGGKERVVPVDAAFFAELAAYLREERPAACRTAECFVVLRGPTAGQPLTEAGLRRIFRTHRLASGALRVRPHRLRHTYGTELNSGMSLQALMALLGHVSTEMTLRYAALAAPAVRIAYEEAMGKARTRLTLAIAPVGQPIIPGRVEWLRAEMLKTRVAHGYCSRQLAAEACPYANICEQCDNYVTAPEFIPQLQAQLADLTALRDDAAARGWHTEVARHSRVIASIQGHLQRLQRAARTEHNA